MLQLNILKNGFEQNLKSPAKNGDIGFDLVAKSVRIVGASYNSNMLDDFTINDPEKDLKKIWRFVEYIEYDTGIQYELINNGLAANFDQKFFGFGPPRSSNSKYNLLLANSAMTIDLGYRGNIKVRFKYYFQPDDLIGIYPDGRFGGVVDHNRIYKVGDRIAQLLFLNFATPIIKIVDKLSETDRAAEEALVLPMDNEYIFNDSEIIQEKQKLVDRGYVTSTNFSAGTDRFTKITIEIILDSNELSRLNFDGLRSAGIIDIYKSEKE